MTRFHAAASRAGAGFAVVALAVAGCTGGASPSAGSSALPVSSLAPAASVATTPAPSDATASNAPSEGVLPSAVATNIDPCQLITSDDASSWTGVKFGAGKENTTEGNVRTCNYDAAGPNLFFVAVGIAPDVATAKAAEAAAEADLESQAESMANLNLTVDKLPGFADNTDAAVLQGGLSAAGQKIAARAMFVLRGTTFFSFSDTAVNSGEPPSEQAFKDKANELLAKLP
jgi:Protein of unknown function (DUF3558)